MPLELLLLLVVQPAVLFVWNDFKLVNATKLKFRSFAVVEVAEVEVEVLLEASSSFVVVAAFFAGLPSLGAVLVPSLFLAGDDPAVAVDTVSAIAIVIGIPLG